MKNIFYILFLGILIWSCSSANKTDIRVNEALEIKGDSEINGDTIRIANDTLEYEILIIEPGFNQWLLSTARPRESFTQGYLEARNRRMVANYNNKAYGTIENRDLYPQPINYEPHINYGFEVNYLLYNYLLYFQQRYRQRL